MVVRVCHWLERVVVARFGRLVLFKIWLLKHTPFRSWGSTWLGEARVYRNTFASIVFLCRGLDSGAFNYMLSCGSPMKRRNSWRHVVRQGVVAGRHSSPVRHRERSNGWAMARPSCNAGRGRDRCAEMRRSIAALHVLDQPIRRGAGPDRNIWPEPACLSRMARGHVTSGIGDTFARRRGKERGERRIVVAHPPAKRDVDRAAVVP